MVTPHTLIGAVRATRRTLPLVRVRARARSSGLAPRVFGKGVPLTTATVGSTSITLRHGEQQSKLSFAWLLDHAKENREPDTGQRRVRISQFGTAQSGLRPLEVRTENGTLEIRWPESVEQHGGSRVSRFLIGELLDAAAKARPPEDSRVAWGARLFSQEGHPTVAAAELRCEEGLRDALLRLRDYGVLRLREMPSSSRETRELVERIGEVLPTFYGEMWSTRAEVGQTEGVSDTAYSNAGIRPHTDGTYFRDPPGLQVLNCVQRAARGGETMLVDGLSVARRMADEQPAALAYLSRTPLPWFSYDEGRLPVRLSQREVALRLDAAGELDQLRFNEYDRGNMHPEAHKEFLPHWCKLVAMVNREDLVLRTLLQPGECLVVNNHRVLHGRTSFFDAEGAEREMIGCYLSRDALDSRLRFVGLLEMCG